MNVDDAAVFNDYVNKVEAAANISVSSYGDYLKALKSRHDYFVANGAKVSDHGLEQIYAEDYTDIEIETIFGKIRKGLH